MRLSFKQLNGYSPSCPMNSFGPPNSPPRQMMDHSTQPRKLKTFTTRGENDTICARVGRHWTVKSRQSAIYLFFIWMIYFPQTHKRTEPSKLLVPKVVIKLSNCFPPPAGKQLYYISNCQKECQERGIFLCEFLSLLPSGFYVLCLT